ncbi:MAG: DUF402 domain-containing protein [Thermodesulfobacteriota bacterium]
MRVKLEGMYSTALSRLLLEAGHQIVEPASELRERLGLQEVYGAADIVVQDRYSLHGVDVLGETERVWEMLRFLQLRLPDAVLVRLDPEEEKDGWVRAAVEFPGASKEVLDKARASVLPTVARHHRLRIVNPAAVKRTEKALSSSDPSEIEEIGGALFQELVMGALGRGGSVRLEHVRVGARPARPREAILLEFSQEGFVAKRKLNQGWYDGLDLPIEEGDYAITEVREGAWSVRHVYYSGNGFLKGEYHNVNTPVEIYPYGARYVDLEVDVVKRPSEKAFLLDLERLELLAREGYVSEQLKHRALEVAHGILDRLNR